MSIHNFKYVKSVFPQITEMDPDQSKHEPPKSKLRPIKGDSLCAHTILT